MSKLASTLPLTSPKQQDGECYERQAIAFLQAQGLTLIAQNWLKAKVGELDAVMIESGMAWDTLVFVEVRKRKRSGFGDAVLSVTPTKQKKIAKTARYFLQAHPEYKEYECRFDVVAFDVDATDNKASPVMPEWVQGAFYADVW